MAFNTRYDLTAFSQFWITFRSGTRFYHKLKKRSSGRWRDALTNDRRYGPPLAVTIRFRTAVLCCSPRNCRVIEGKRAATHRGFADNRDTIASEFETRWFSHFRAHSGAHAIVNQTNIATSFLPAKIAEIMLLMYEVTRIAKYVWRDDWRLDSASCALTVINRKLLHIFQMYLSRIKAIFHWNSHALVCLNVMFTTIVTNKRYKKKKNKWIK